MSVDWKLHINPVTFQPCAGLILNGRRLPVEISLEQAQDRNFNENELMLLLLNKLSDSDILEAFSTLKDKYLKPTK